MCGFCGIALADPRATIDNALLKKMGDVIAHRGPDGSGIHNAQGVGLAHRRLSIIDVEGGGQPISNEDGSVVVVFNGEIYNFARLRDELQKRGHVFRTCSDTEVLVHGYEEYGVGFARQLHGMFAYALHDMRNGRLLLVRDHVGIKPLFYSVLADRLLFGSEIKAITTAMGRTPASSRAAVQEYLIFRHTAWDRTMYEGVQRLPPGHIGIWERGHLRMDRFWSPNDVAPARTVAARRTAAKAFEEQLAESVRAQMISEVPLGTFCSGGLDSGLVTAFAALASPHPVKSFSVGFAERAWDESALARETSAKLGTDHYSIVASAEELLDLLPSLIWFNDEPLSQPNSVPLYVLSGLARQHVTVALTGEGSDELFGGYPRYRIEQMRKRLGPVAQPVGRLGGAVGRIIDHRRLRLFGDLLAQPASDGRIFNSAFVRPAMVAALTGGSLEEALLTRGALARELEVPGHALASLMRYEIMTYLGGLLERMDRMAMAHGLEGRVPFLHVPLLECALALSPDVNVTARVSKRLVRDVASRHLPARVLYAPKSGFGLPLADWFRRPLFDALLRRLQHGDHGVSDHVEGGKVRTLVREHLAGSGDHSEALWLLLNLALWQDQPPRPTSLNGLRPTVHEPAHLS